MSGTAEAFAAAAAGLSGVPFRLHGRDAASGVDCVGLVALALAQCGREVTAPEGYALRALDLRGLLGFAAANGFAAVADPVLAAGDLLLLRVAPIQAHLAVALAGERWVHAHAGLGRVTVEHGLAPYPIEARWRLAERD